MKINHTNSYYDTNRFNFNANCSIKHRLSLIDAQRFGLSVSNAKPILSGDFVNNYTQKVNKLGKDTDFVEIIVEPYAGTLNFLKDCYNMSVTVIRNNEKYDKAKALLMCPNIIKSLPLFLEDEYKWLVRWFKDKNGTEKLLV